MNKKNYSYFFLAFLTIACVLGVFNLNIHENLNDSIPTNSYLEKLVPFIDEGKKTIIFSLDIDPSQNILNIDSIAKSFTTKLSDDFPNRIDSLQYKSDIDPDEFSTFISEHLYLFLEENNYDQLDSLIALEAMRNAMVKNKEHLMNAQSIGLSKMVIDDPLHFLPLAYKNISNGLDLESLMKNQGFYFSKNQEKLLLHSSILFDPSNVELLKAFSEDLDHFKTNWNNQNETFQLDYFGTFLITVANASQIKWDIILTINFALLFIMLLLYFYYRSIVTIVFFILPGIFGIAMSLAVVWLLQGGISALALSASAVILGIVVDYSFHYFSHLSQEKDAYQTRDQILTPLIISSLTTIIAFLSLLFAQSQALKDFGLFTGLSLLFTLLFIIIFLPGLIEGLRSKKSRYKSNNLDKLIARFDNEKPKKKPVLIILFSALSILFFYYSFDVQFEDNLNNLNYYPKELKQKEIAHQNINPDKEKRITVLATGKNLDEALSANYQLFKKVNSSQLSTKITEYNSIAPFIYDKETSTLKAKKWIDFWGIRLSEFNNNFSLSTTESGFNTNAFNRFLQKLSAEPKEVNYSTFIKQHKSIGKLVLQQENVNIVSSIRVQKTHLKDVKAIQLLKTWRCRKYREV